MDIITNKIKERFCKDNSLNIKIFQEPYFSERLKLYDNQFDTLKKWKLFLDEISEFKNDEEYLNYYNKVKEDIIDFIKNQPSYEKFQNFDMNKYSSNNYNIPFSNIFNKDNNNKKFISIDLKKGCYSALRYFDKSLIGNTNSYEEFLSKFTNKKSIIESKNIRQIIFGNCSPKRQSVIERYMMSLILDKLYKLDLNFSLYNNDEIIINYDEKSKNKLDKIKKIVYETTRDNNFDVHFEIFNLKRVKDSDVYIKYFLDGKKPEIKCANHFIMPFILRELKNEKPNLNDFIFYDNGNLSVLLTVNELNIKNEIMFNKILKENEINNYLNIHNKNDEIIIE